MFNYTNLVLNLTVFISIFLGVYCSDFSDFSLGAREIRNDVEINTFGELKYGTAFKLNLYRIFFYSMLIEINILYSLYKRFVQGIFALMISIFFHFHIFCRAIYSGFNASYLSLNNIKIRIFNITFKQKNISY